MKELPSIEQLQAKLDELQKKHADLVNGPDPDSNAEAIAKLAEEIEQLELALLEAQDAAEKAEKAAAEQEAAAAAKASFKVSDDLQKAKGKELRALEPVFKKAAAKFPGEEVVIMDYAIDQESNTITVVLHAEKQGMRKVVRTGVKK